MTDWEEYFRLMIERDKGFPILPAVNEKPCSDCPVVFGMYREISDALKEQPADIQKAVSDKWFCHQSKLQCRGNLNNLRGCL